MGKYIELENEWEKVQKSINRKALLIENGMLFIPIAIATTLLKYYRENINEVAKKKAEEEKIYHFTSENSAKKIMESGYLKAGKSFMTAISSYGKTCVNAFLGMPKVDDLIKNISGDIRKNIGANVYLDPYLVLNAIEISPQKEDMRGWQTRPLADSAVIINGAYLLPMERTNHVKVGFDLQRDENGNPVFDYKKKMYTIIAKTLKEKDFDENGHYMPPQDFLEVVKEQSEKLGFTLREDKNKLRGNRLQQLFTGARFEQDVYVRSIRNNLLTSIINRFRTPKLLASREENMQNYLANSAFNTVNPNARIQKVTRYAADLMTQRGICQEPITKSLDELNNSKEGEFLRRKREQMDLSGIPENGLHGLKHSNRVSFLAMRIAQKAGFLEGDTSNRLKDILTTASYYHDLGRVRLGVAWDYGRHAKRSIKKLKNKNIRFLDGTEYSETDMNLLKLIIEGHETKKDEEFDILVEKYNISDEDRVVANQMFRTIKDADALDRVRIDKEADKILLTKGSVNLNFKYLRTDAARSLVFAAYELEGLSRQVPTKEFTDILKYKVEEEQMNQSSTRQTFLKGLEVSQDIKEKITSMPQITKKKIITFSKTTGKQIYRNAMSKFTNIKDFIKEFMNDETGR